MLKRKISPYLKPDDRLVNVIATIQAMGTYRYYKRNIEDWADRISGKKEESAKWKKVFEDHPEFFRFSQGGSDKSNITGSYYKDITNEKDENNSCEIGYLDVIEDVKLKSDWGMEFIENNIID